MYAFNPDGTFKWDFDTYLSDTGENRTNVWSRTIYSSPTIGSDGIIYFATNNGGNLYALNPDGSLKWKYRVGEYISGYVIGADGTIYVGSGSYCENGSLYAINPDGTVEMELYCRLGY